MKASLPLSLLLFAVCGSAVAAVYRCEQNGQVTYTDRPCGANASPAKLPALTTAPRDAGAEALANQYDADAAAEARARAGADGEWLKSHRAATERDAQTRKALVENRIIKGMTREQVQRVLNLPTRVEHQGEAAGERWIYENGRERRAIAFKNGLVSGDSTRGSSSR